MGIAWEEEAFFFFSFGAGGGHYYRSSSPPPLLLPVRTTVSGSLVLLTRSDLWLPSRCGLPLGWVRVASASVFSVSEPCLWWYTFCFCLRSVPLPRSHLEFSSWRVRPVGCIWLPLVLCPVRFLVLSCGGSFPPHSSSFRPSSGSSLVSFCSSRLRSLLSCWLLVVLWIPFVSSFQFMVLSSFIGHSSLVPSSSVSCCFRVLLLRSVTRFPLWFYLGEGVARWAESLLFFFVPSCSTPVVHQALVCCFLFFLLGSMSGILSLPSSFCLGSFGLLYWWVSFPSSFCVYLPVQPSCLVCWFCIYCPLPFFPFLHEVFVGFLPWFGVYPFRVSLPLSFVSPHLVPLGFVLPLLIPAFSFSLFFVSLVRPLVLLV